MGVGQGDDLACVGGVAEDFLVARHRGIEYHFTDRLAGRAYCSTPEYGAVGERKDGWGRQENLRQITES